MGALMGTATVRVAPGRVVWCRVPPVIVRPCAGAERHRPNSSGRYYVYAVYCRNGAALSEVTGWTSAQGPDDPDMLDLYKGVLRNLFSASELLRQDHKPSFR